MALPKEYRFSEKQRGKMSEAKKGKPSGMLGKIAWNKGLKKENNKIVANSTIKMTNTVKNQYKNGRISGAKGRKKTQEEIEKRKQTMLNNPYVPTENTRRKISTSNIGHKGYWKGNSEHGRQIGLLGLKKQQENKKPTNIEQILYDYLTLKNISFKPQKLINNRFLVDAYIPSLHTVIEADGNYWHSLPRVMKKDKAENAYLKKCGFNLLRLKEQEILNGSFKERMVL